ncbi:MAG TPA: UDP-glucose 4-epimerase GalE [Patescibacteria group bacterium]|nr:UDP-glucose 4-epimerase GalE [Patescibacteria group bacterium]
MKILVTGGAGYIGSHMTRMLTSRGYEPIVLDTLEFGHKQAIPNAVPLIVGSVGDEQVVRKIFQEHSIDAVFHFAGYLQVEESVRLPIKYIKNNVLAPTVLLEEMRLAGVGKIIFSSTAAVYGNPETNLIGEDHPKNPVSPYGLSKWAFEELLRVYDRSFGLRSISLRYFNACGASLDGEHGEVHEPETHLLPLACKAVLGQRNDFAIYGNDYDTPDGTAIRDFIHIEDLCEAHVVALEALSNGHKTDVYNIGTGKGVSVSEVVEEVGRTSHKAFVAKKSGRRVGDPAILVSDPSKIMKEFGWNPTYSDIQTIVDSALEWHKSHPNGYA